MTISIVDYELLNDTHNYYDVSFFSDRIHTLVTHDPKCVSDWLSETERFQSRHLSHLIVGLDVEWRPNFNRNQENPVAIIQLCVGHRCLIFQILQCVKTYNESIPKKLREFLAKEEYTFVGVGIESDVEKLVEDYEIGIGGKTVDLRNLAAEKYDLKSLKNAGLKELARVVLEKEIEKPKWVTMSKWDNLWLIPNQVQYACVDAFVSFEIGKRLNASS
ncbi:hypothetical protein M9H77_28465 [Catharanthus roseus]|uniref:Uncharacterized protein n=1 Tax=Catharanthus roseus TaxID=4058 RepID=A0ACC0AI31_CATRO|nr:hypothetical protein M9H77_28465 [Catharanthus roseus]